MKILHKHKNKILGFVTCLKCGKRGQLIADYDSQSHNGGRTWYGPYGPYFRIHHTTTGWSHEKYLKRKAEDPGYKWMRKSGGSVHKHKCCCNVGSSPPFPLSPSWQDKLREIESRLFIGADGLELRRE